jgi:hypothetical protein
MKGFFLIPVIILGSIADHPAIHFSTGYLKDTTIITHQLDGNIDEWPSEKFITDKETRIRFAMDNDAQSLFLALTITDNATQRKIMQSGINLYIDIKGKKKENTGIEYPVESNLGSMKLFGFSNSEPAILSIISEGTVNIAFSWDSSNVLHVEYNIPLQLLEETVSGLNNKKISVGWKLNESEMNNGLVTSQFTPVASGGRNRAAAPSRSGSDFPQSTTIKYKSFWTSHTIVF